MDQEVEIKKSLLAQFELDGSSSISMDALRDALSAKINHLVQANFQQLVYILYRIDVNESRLRLLLRDFPGEDAGRIIADLIIERQAEKIKTREQFRNQRDIDENEKW